MTDDFICKRGHRRSEVGYTLTQSGGKQCNACRKILAEKNYAERKARGGRVSPWPDGRCANGHVIAETGVEPVTGKCAACQRHFNRVYHRKKADEKARRNPNSLKYARHIPNLESMRQQLGYGRSEFARRTGVSKSVIEKIERDGQRARPYVLQRILPFIAAEIQKEKVSRYA